ncbi:MAG: hypothetical protein R2865_05470 [Deinococcales bacterium]
MGVDSSGKPYGGNPITGLDGTPLIPGTELDDALLLTGPGNGKVGLSNGFWADENGNAIFMTTVDFPIVGGAYPFHKFEGFDASDERLPLKTEARAVPIAIVTSGVAFTLRLASHCTDGVNHGLVAGPHEGWFDWIAEE